MRNLYQTREYTHKDCVQLDGYANIALDASVVSNTITGVATVARTAAGTYTITLRDSYPALVGLHFQEQCLANSIFFKVIAGATDVSGAKTIVFKTCNTSGAATDTTTGIGVYVSIIVRKNRV